MKDKNEIKALCSNDTIVLHHDGKVLNIQKANRPKDFKRVNKLIEARDIKGLKKAFVDIKAAIEKFSGKKMTVSDGQLLFKDTSEVVPKAIGKKLIKLKDAGEDFMPLWRFWKKLSQNPSEESKKDLYAFISTNDIPITELGDLITEKGVNECDGDLVDCHTGKIDNSIGSIVKMKRDDVDPDRNNTCSAGLHVGAPDYVRKWWSSDLVVLVKVNPKDVVAVPNDHDNAKMRVCKYEVVGVAKKSRKELVVKLEDLVVFPTIIRSDIKITDLEKLTAKRIIEYVKDKTDVDLSSISLKNKKLIVKKGTEVLLKTEEEKDSKIVITGIKYLEIAELVRPIVGNSLVRELVDMKSNMWRAKFIKAVTPKLEEKGYVLVD